MKYVFVMHLKVMRVVIWLVITDEHFLVSSTGKSYQNI